jgi:hypothetical protein
MQWRCRVRVQFQTPRCCRRYVMVVEDDAVAPPDVLRLLLD